MVYMTEDKIQKIVEKAVEELSPETAEGLADILINAFENLDKITLPDRKLSLREILTLISKIN